MKTTLATFGPPGISPWAKRYQNTLPYGEASGDSQVVDDVSAPQKQPPVPHYSHPEPAPDEAPSNPFLDKINARFISAASSLTAAAAALDGRDHVSAKELDDIRWAASSVARSCDAVEAIAKHFEQALLTPGGDDLGSTRNAGLREAQMRGLVCAALAGEVRA